MAKATAAGLDEAQANGLAEMWEDGEDRLGPASARRLLVAAVDAFAARGYHGTSTRDIADRAGLSPAGVYVHFASKEDLFFRITLLGHERTLHNAVTAVQSVGEAGPARRLHAVIEAQTTWQARHHTTARVVEYDLPCLSPEHYEQVAAIRRKITALVRGILNEGVRAGVFDVPDVDGMTLALLSMVTDVARWYPSNGRQSPEQLGTLYADLALRMAAPHSSDS
ncbi:TetR family transcriptional regulator [Actinospica sp. MGRD01-02]|uniref:TetR family transcriptional regulator n=1 Tax=Actinospica acidithermotolerans TaxID=2828514 RepID=A0A941IIX1_9ACTN|nr:TetR/AcrR family transcriptional regulator [Actinospica acidithermotolerans]MBR7830115.1 TetR family transcriptional regulator [Actinospica acidithermotolerans]